MGKVVDGMSNIQGSMDADNPLARAEITKGSGMTADADEDDEDKKKAKDEDYKKDMKDEDKKDDKKEGAMDAKLAAMSKEFSEFKNNGTKMLLQQIAERDTLVNQLVPHIGVFDHATKTLDEVAKYGLDKLGLKCARGHEHSVLTGYLAGKRSAQSVLASASGSAQDSLDDGKDDLSQYLS